MNSRIVVRIVAVATIAFALVTAWQLGVFELLSQPEETAALLRSLGLWGQLAYVAGFALLAPAFVPGIFFMVPAAMIWPDWLAMALSLAGATGAGVVGFTFARFFARDWASQRIPASLRSRVEALETRPVRTTLVIRLMFFLFPPSHWALGVSEVRFGPHLAGTFLGYIPFVVATTLIGGSLMEWLGRQSPVTWAVAAIVAAGIFVLNRRNRRRRAGIELERR